MLPVSSSLMSRGVMSIRGNDLADLRYKICLTELASADIDGKLEIGGAMVVFPKP
jgi:hypothetical protein